MAIRIRSALALIAASAACFVATAQARDSAGEGRAAAWAVAQAQSRPSANFLERLFGREERAAARGETDTADARDEGGVQLVQMSPADLVVRLERLEAQIRQLTGAVEQLQFRNQQLEQQLRRTPEEGEARPADAGPRGAARAPPPAAAVADPTPAPPPVAGRRSDAFDPSQHPGAPGAPRSLGTQRPLIAEEETPIGAPGGRGAGAPLDLATLSEQSSRGAPVAAPRGGGLPPPPPRNPNATGAGPQQMVAAPSNSPKDEYDLAYGYILRKDYALAEEAFRAFLDRHPGDRMVADASYWLGESLFQRQRYREAAEFFLSVTTKHATLAKAPDSLLRLGQSLAALKEKDAACATFAEIERKYPRASPTVRQSAEREKKRAGC